MVSRQTSVYHFVKDIVGNEWQGAVIGEAGEVAV